MKPFIAWTSLLIAALMPVAAAQNGEPLPEPTPAEEAMPMPTPSPTPDPVLKPAYPPFHNLRFEEDWTFLKNAAPADFWDPLKYIPLNSEGSIYLSFGGQLRLRGEGWNNFDFGSSANKDAVFGLSRLRLHGDLHLGEFARLFAEAKSSLITERNLPGGQRAIDLDALDLQQAFLDLRWPWAPGYALTLRTGRQEMQLGRQRLISPLDWANTRRSWDGARLMGQLGDYRLDGFYAQPVKVQPWSFNAPFSAGIQNFGFQASGKIPTTAFSAEAYWLGWLQDTAKFGNKEGFENRQTLGAHLWGKTPLENLDFDLEGGYQFGSHADQAISAFFWASEAGYQMPLLLDSRVYLGFDYASGDQSPDDGSLNTFNQMLPLGHAYHGYVDTVGRQNIVDLNGGLAVKPWAQLTLKLDGHAFWRASSADALYNAGGAVVRPGSAGPSPYVGSEADLTATWRPDRHLAIELGLNYFLPGAFIQEAGALNGIAFGYLQTSYTF